MVSINPNSALYTKLKISQQNICQLMDNQVGAINNELSEQIVHRSVMLCVAAYRLCQWYITLNKSLVSQ